MFLTISSHNVIQWELNDIKIARLCVLNGKMREIKNINQGLNITRKLTKSENEQVL